DDWTEDEREQGIRLLSSVLVRGGIYDRYDIIRIVDPDASAELRLVYALGYQPHQPADVVRLWVARRGDSWRIYDIETVGVDRSLSAIWLDELQATEGNFDAFSDVIQRHVSLHRKATTGKLPRQDADSLIAELTGAFVAESAHDEIWQSIILQLQTTGSQEGVRHFEHEIRDPKSVPSVLLAFAWAHAETYPVWALLYADRYEKLLGPCPKLSRAKCDIYAAIEEADKLITECHSWLRVPPDD